MNTAGNRNGGIVARALCVALCAALYATTTPVARAQSATAAESVRRYDIPAGSLSAALSAWGAQSDRQLVFAPDVISGKQSKGVSGRYGAEQALTQLLAGTGLTWERVNGQTIAIKRASAPAAEPQAKARSMQATGQSPEPEVKELEKMTVTGSRISGALPTSPLRMITREEIDRSGYGNVSDLVRSLPENFSGGLNKGVLGAPSPNQNISNSVMINLRGLGADATLSLVNGRRMAADTLGQSSDVSVIPLAAISRIDIVTDGSSAIYGSDAVAGVANFILRNDYDGLDLSARLGTSTQGGGFEQIYSALAGKSAENWNAMLAVEYGKQDAILASERDFTAGSPPNLTLSRPFERTSVFFSGGARISDRVTVDVDALWNDRNVSFLQQNRLAASAIQSTSKTPSYSIGGGMKISLPADWGLNINATTSHSRTDQVNYSTTSATLTRYDNEIRSAELMAEGALFNLPSGAVKTAVGAGWREENSSRGSGGLNVSHESKYVFGEAYIPLVPESLQRQGLQALDLSLSGRHEDYSDFGETSTPKVGIRYVPFSGLTLRGTWGKSFKTPSFQQVAADPIITITQASAAGYVGPGTVIFALGGNSDLNPERSTSFTVGADYIPSRIPSMNLAATYFNIDYTDRVVSPVSPTSAALTNPAFAAWVIRNPSASVQSDWLSAATRVINASGTPYDPESVVAIVNNRPANAAAQTAEGIDLSYRQEFDLADSRLDAFANATWLEVKQQTLPELPQVVRSGMIFNVPEFRARAGIAWEKGAFTLATFMNYQSGSTDDGITPNRRIDSQTTFDGNLSFMFPAVTGALNGVSVDLSITNLFDRDPPFAASPAVAYLDGIYYDSTNASPIGRFIAITIRKQF